MEFNRFIAPACNLAVLAALVLLMQTASSLQTSDHDLTQKHPEDQLSNRTQAEFDTKEQRPAPTSGRSMDGRTSSARGGRMLDLDRLVGDIKPTKEQSRSGDRQSRILTEDISTGNKLEARSKAKGKKKMAIKGFIPIVSLEGAKEGKHFENPLESSQDDEGEEEEPEQQSQPLASATRDQLMSNYGGQTSIGHASFAPQQAAVSYSQLPSSWPASSQAQSGLYQDQSQEAGRANRKLAGNLLGGFSNPSRLVSTLVQPQHVHNQLTGHPTLQSPINLAQIAGLHQPDQGGDCICVPFFQCRNGFLSESQLSKGQLQQIANIQGPAAATFGAPNHLYQVPRSSASEAGPTRNQQQQQHLSRGNLQQSEQQQQIVNDIYEQLRKNVDRDQLLQQLANQPTVYPLVDERSQVGGQQQESNQSSTGPESDVLGRSLLNPLGRRSSGQAQRCGIMRTCCRIPVSLQQQQQQQQPQPQQQISQWAPSLQAHRGPQQFQRGLQNQPARPVSEWEATQGMGMQPSTQPDYQQASAHLAPSFLQNQPPMNGPLYQVEPAQRPPVGSFMAGRCGTRQTMGITGRVQNVQPAPGSESSAEFGEFPAHAAILKRISPGDSLFVCSAALVSNLWLATAAHCVRRQRPEELKVRLGEWDVNRDDEFYPFAEFNIREIVVHPDFQASSLVNDLALLRLENPIDGQQMPHIAPACLANPNELFVGQRCWLAGWGKDAFGQQGAFQSVLRKVDLPVVGHQECESALRYQTKLGRFFRLHSSALCAGGERGKDACEGDGGAGLYCTEPESGLTKLAGLVSWGVGCGQRGVPGVYTNVATFYGWIESVVAASGEESLYLDRNGVSENAFKSLVSERTSTNTNATITAEARAAGNGTLATEGIGEQRPPGPSDDGTESRAG